MPGKSKKGGGLESSPVYNKQKFGAPFKMKGFSGFGNSPLKQGTKKTLRGSKTITEEDGVKTKTKYTKSGKIRKEKRVERDEFGRVISREVYKYDKEGSIRKARRSRGPAHEEGRSPSVTAKVLKPASHDESTSLYYTYPRVYDSVDIKKDAQELFPETFDSPLEKRGPKEITTRSRFETAFALARGAGKKTFEFEGKTYKTYKTKVK